MRTLTIALVHDGEVEQDSYDFFNEVLSPLLEHVDCDVHIVHEAPTTARWVAERTGDAEDALCLENPQSNEGTATPGQRLYVDATVIVPVPDARKTTTDVRVFGPFSDRGEAERGLSAFMGRENAMGAIIRDPQGGTNA